MPQWPIEPMHSCRLAYPLFIGQTQKLNCPGRFWPVVVWFGLFGTKILPKYFAELFWHQIVDISSKYLFLADRDYGLFIERNIVILLRTAPFNVKIWNNIYINFIFN